MMLLTGDEALSVLKSWMCDCGHKLIESDVFESVKNGFRFTCPDCGFQFSITRVAEN